MLRKRSNNIYAMYFMVQIIVTRYYSSITQVRCKYKPSTQFFLSVKAKERGYTMIDRGKDKKSWSTIIIIFHGIYSWLLGLHKENSERI